LVRADIALFIAWPPNGFAGKSAPPRAKPHIAPADTGASLANHGAKRAPNGGLKAHHDK
jgi:hypothetical protein